MQTRIKRHRIGEVSSKYGYNPGQFDQDLEARKARSDALWAGFLEWMKLQGITPDEARGLLWYGGKGICVCNEWQEYEFFRDWALKNGYEENLTIDRIDSEKDYSPKNCRWITASENSKRVKHPKSERRICVNGESKTESAWAKLTGVSQAAISGWVCKYGEDFASKKIAAHIALR